MLPLKEGSSPAPRAELRCRAPKACPKKEVVKLASAFQFFCFEDSFGITLTRSKG